MLNRIAAISKKEIKQLIRDKRMMFVIFFFPVFLLIIFGYAVNFDVENIKIAVRDNDKSALSRDLISTISSSSYFEVVEYYDNNERANTILNEGIAKGILIIPIGFEKEIYSAKKDVKIQILLDGVDGNTATIIQNYSLAAILSFNKKLNKMATSKIGVNFETPIDVQSRFWFNPELQTTIYLIPGLIALILIVTAVIAISLSFVREKERGTIEQINVSSVRILELLVGKLFPYLVISFINASVILLAGYILFGVIVNGSYALLIISTLLFLFASTSIGIFISVIANSQQVAFSIATFVSLLPSTILSGFIFPIDSMPPIIQVLTNITPAKYFIVVLRGIIIKGVGLNAFWEQWIYLLLFSSFFLILSIIIYNKSLKKA
ncbi:MAG: ABC transporter permease [Bacteroidetes bacterium]|nr:ABC transporter permease [Bacteroidota bacterium]MBU1113820.1 ABC transporter permease [Bacteroidota bacterium]MBU1799594.1 ABC transporter permease [Bacteroidota bacterium]